MIGGALVLNHHQAGEFSADGQATQVPSPKEARDLPISAGRRRKVEEDQRFSGKVG